MSEFMTSECGRTIEEICNGTKVSYHLVDTARSGHEYTDMLIKGSQRAVRETRYLIGQKRRNEELRRKAVRNRTTTLSRQLDNKGWQTLVTKLDRAALTKTEVIEAQERHFDAVDEVLKNESNSSNGSHVSSKSSDNDSMSDIRGASGYCLVSMAQEDENDEPEPGEDPCVDHINTQIMQYAYCLRSRRN
jgi:hypothetical protein